VAQYRLDLREREVLLVQTSPARVIQRDFETAVMQAIVD
jgi:hypothetical protein